MKKITRLSLLNLSTGRLNVAGDQPTIVMWRFPNIEVIANPDGSFVYVNITPDEVREQLIKDMQTDDIEKQLIVFELYCAITGETEITLSYEE